MANSSPFAKAIGQATQGAFPGSLPGPIGALPATNPLTSPAPGAGGGSSDAGAFRPEPSPAAGQPPPTGPLGASAPSPPAPVQPGPAPQPGGNPGGNATVLSTAASLGIPPLGAGPNIQPDIDEFNTSGYMSPVMRAMIPGQLEIHHGQQMLSAIEPLLQQMSGDHLSIPDLLKTQMRISALSGGKGGGMGIAGLAGLLHPVNVPGMLRTDALPPGTIDAFGNPIDPETTPFVRVQKSLLGGPDQYYPEMGGTKVQIQPDPESKTGWARVIYDATGNVIKRTLGMAPPVGFAPQTSSSTLNVPGQLPQTTTTQRQRSIPGIDTGTGGKTLQTRPSASGGGGSTSVPSPGGPVTSLIGRKYEDWVNGGPAPTGKDLTAVQEYARTHKLQTPVPMSAKGSGDLAAIEPVIQEIQDLKAKLKREKLDQDDSHKLVPEYLRYAHGLGSTAHDDLFTSLSFEQLRSAAAAMKGMNSRAFPILNRALQHTPTLDRALGLLPDTPKTMYDKLSTMETILNQGRDAILRDERKSGVTGAAPSAIPPVASPRGNDPLGIR